MRDALCAEPKSSEQDNDDDLPCPMCGYDLRATDGDRCPECGFAVDLSRLVPSRIPWVHRRLIGRARAYRRTVWLVLRRPATLGAEASRPADFQSAESFRWVTVALATFGPAAAAVAAFSIGAANLAQAAVSSTGGPSNSAFGASSDLALPWAAGVLLWVTPPLALFITMALVTGVPGFWFRPRRLPMERRNAAVALSHYAGASMVLLVVPALAIVSLWGMVTYGYASRHPNSPLVTLAAMAAPIGLSIVGLLLLTNTLSIYRAATRAGIGRVVLMLIVLPIAWQLSAVIGLWLVPWLIGFIRLMVVSLR